MTEAEWLGCDDPEKMLGFLETSGKLSWRRGRLFGVAVCRRIWPLLADQRCKKVVEVAELFADGRASEEERAEAVNEASRVREDLEWGTSLDKETLPLYQAANAATFAGATEADFSQVLENVLLVSLVPEQVSSWATEAASSGGDKALAGQQTQTKALWDELRSHCTLLRDIFGNPFRPPPAIDPAWLVWNDGTVKRLAEAIYEQRRFSDLPILADALEDAGCADAVLLEHLRGPEPHCRGCWAIDLLLGRE
jgi:hypothetical protein